jgi:hypothetical protein
MKIIFLDIDGVLNNEVHYIKQLKAEIKQYWGPDGLDEDNIKVLNAIIEKTGAKVVLSSSWRLHFKLDEIESFLKEKGFKYTIFAKTTSYIGVGCSRGDEIKLWVNEWNQDIEYVKDNDAVTHFVAFDDIDDMEVIKENFVLIDDDLGLTEDYLPKIYNILGIYDLS